MKKQEMTEIRIKKFEDELLEAMTRMPYRDITVNQLIQAVGVTRKTFYLHFANKDACLDSLMDRELLAQSAYAASYADNLLAMHLAGCRFWLSRRIFLECILKNDLFTAFLKRMLRHNQTEDREIMQILCSTLPEDQYDADTCCDARQSNLPSRPNQHTVKELPVPREWQAVLRLPTA